MDGLINFLKPPGMSSNGAVGFFKRLLNVKKVGHAGTLDPGAAGVLVILVGKATKLSPYVMSKPKEYVFEITFGSATDTLDAYGTVTQSDDSRVSRNRIEAVLPNFTGVIEQIPPMYSAININGKRAYQLARSGKSVEIKPRQVTISSLELLDETEKSRFLLKAECSKGTYIRTLALDIAKALNTCAYTSFLERTRSGCFSLENAVLIEEVQTALETGCIEEMILPMDNALTDLPKVIVNDSDYKRIINGLDGGVSNVCKNIESDDCRIFCQQQLIGIGYVKEMRARIKTQLLTKE